MRFFIWLMTSILGANVTFPQQLFSGAWMSLAVLAWNLAIATLIGLSAVQMRITAYVHIIERIAGAILAGFGGDDPDDGASCGDVTKPT
jgi:threonine/homoserine/homoserine lactone efflux protein